MDHTAHDEHERVPVDTGDQFAVAVVCNHGKFTPCKYRPATKSYPAGYYTECGWCGRLFTC